MCLNILSVADDAKPNAWVSECALYLRVCVTPSLPLHALGALYPSIPCSWVRFLLQGILYMCAISQEECVISLSLCVCVGRSVTRLWYELAGMSCLFWVWRSALRSWACPPFSLPSSIICSQVSRTVWFTETSSLTSTMFTEWTLCWRLEILYNKTVLGTKQVIFLGCSASVV